MLAPGSDLGGFSPVDSPLYTTPLVCTSYLLEGPTQRLKQTHLENPMSDLTLELSFAERDRIEVALDGATYRLRELANDVRRHHPTVLTDQAADQLILECEECTQLSRRIATL